MAARKLAEQPDLTWEDAVALEPSLADLFAEATQTEDDGEYFCANMVWYRTMKPRLCDLVGWGRKRGPYSLTTSDAYDLAYDKIYDQLPNCRGCWCW